MAKAALDTACLREEKIGRKNAMSGFEFYLIHCVNRVEAN